MDRKLLFHSHPRVYTVRAKGRRSVQCLRRCLAALRGAAFQGSDSLPQITVPLLSVAFRFIPKDNSGSRTDKQGFSPDQKTFQVSLRSKSAKVSTIYNCTPFSLPFQLQDFPKDSSNPGVAWDTSPVLGSCSTRSSGSPITSSKRRG